MKLSARSLIISRLMKSEDRGAIGYIVMWLLGIPASVLFIIFLMRGCT